MVKILEERKIKILFILINTGIAAVLAVITNLFFGDLFGGGLKLGLLLSIVLFVTMQLTVLAMCKQRALSVTICSSAVAAIAAVGLIFVNGDMLTLNPTETFENFTGSTQQDVEDYLDKHGIDYEIESVTIDGLGNEHVVGHTGDISAATDEMDGTIVIYVNKNLEYAEEIDGEEND